MARQGLELSIGQKQQLRLTPQLLQSLRVLGMTGVELGSYIEAELEGNPTLVASWGEEQPVGPGPVSEGERAGPDRGADDFDWAEYLQDKGYDDASYGFGAPSDIAPDPDVAGTKLSDYLIEQLTPADLLLVSKDALRAYDILAWIADTLDENGFLTQDAPGVAKETGAETTEIEAAISVLQGLDPAGVAAADVRESLALQYERAGGADTLVLDIIKTRLEDVGSWNTASVSRALGCKRSDVERAFEIIAGLDPKPGSGLQDGAETHYIVPDIIVEKTEDGYDIKMGADELPVLTVSPYYRKILAESEKGSEARNFLTERLNAAVSLIRSLEQRRQIMRKIVAAILTRQQAFFDSGPAYLKPMTLRQIAEETGVHESTVSRAVRGKYIQTQRGVIELRQFFSSGVRTADGEGAASGSVKARISALMDAEDKRNPLSDRKIAVLLEKEGIFISRRTVAKYRLETGAPSSDKRARR